MLEWSSPKQIKAELAKKKKQNAQARRKIHGSAKRLFKR